MDKNFQSKVKLALSGFALTTLPHRFKRGYYVTDYLVNDNLTFEILHKGKALPTIDKVYAVREKLNIEK